MTEAANPIDLADIVESAGPYLPEALVSKASHAAITAAISHLPSLVTRGGGFECRLGDAPRGPDFYFSPWKERDRPDELAPSLLESPVWRGLQRFWREWISPGSALARAPDELWLELDIQSAEAVPAPLVFFAPPRDGAARAETARWATEAALPLLHGGPVREAVAAAVVACSETLPEGARLGYVGSLLARGSRAVRLCLSDFPSTEIESFLERVACPGAADGRFARLRAFEDVLPRVTLDVDVLEDGGVGPSIGVEYDFFAEAPRPAHEPRYAALLERAVAAGACGLQKRDAVLAWPGVAPHRFDSAWRLRTLLHRRLSHIKLACAPGRPLEAKAYLACWIGAAS
jgi:hypothetical protein